MPFKTRRLGVSVAKIATQWQIAEFGVRNFKKLATEARRHREKAVQNPQIARIGADFLVQMSCLRKSASSADEQTAGLI